MKDLLVREGRVDGIASAKLRGRVAAAEASGFGIDLKSIVNKSGKIRSRLVSFTFS